MKGSIRLRSIAIATLLIGVAPSLKAQGDNAEGCDEVASARIHVDHGQVWRPPFGLGRVGSGLVARVEVDAKRDLRGAYYLVGYRNGSEVERHGLEFRKNQKAYMFSADDAALYASNALSEVPSAIGLRVQCGGRDQELVAQDVSLPMVEAGAEVRSEAPIHPVDLGTVMVPHDWLLLAVGQNAIINVAAFAYERDMPDLKLHVTFVGGRAVEIAMPLTYRKKEIRELKLPAPKSGRRNVLSISITDGGREIWRRDIQTMLVSRAIQRPSFGAVETELRYDAPILTVDPRTGHRVADTSYEGAWNANLKDVVVFLPNGARFVFWRGANYIPFWASRNNTGVLYQWAENCTRAMQVTQPDGTRDCPEPLFDSQLRYSRVRVEESSQSRVHVRWDYQLTDVRYEVWGGAASEDFYFYPDGFGTRVVTVPSARGDMYQLSEFIVMTPQAAYPLEVLPKYMIEAVPLDADKERVEFPVNKPKVGRVFPNLVEPRTRPMVYRVFAHKDDSMAAIYFHPTSSAVPWAYLPLYNKGDAVTPAYWGNHWPLNRGKWTVWGINDLISISPSHNSVAAFSPPRDPDTGDLRGGFEVDPISSGVELQPDARGRVRSVDLSRFAWLIGYTDLPDEELRDWGRSFSSPPAALVLRGGRLDIPAYSQERRALRMVAEEMAIEVKITPAERAVNPVFEIDRAPKAIAGVAIDGNVLRTAEYAWDGHVLWIKAKVGTEGAVVSIRF